MKEQTNEGEKKREGAKEGGKEKERKIRGKEGGRL